MKFLSVCSGIEAASVALEPLGFACVGHAEIDKAAARLLAHRFPRVRNFGDFTTIDPAEIRADWLIGGTPCQAFSIAGKRLSLADARGNLTLAYAALAHELIRTCGLQGALWENVPGVLSMADNAFGCFLGALVGASEALSNPSGKRWPDVGMVAGPRGRAAWRILDAQYFGLPQRRRRVFVVVGFGNRIDPAAILFERQGLRGHPPTRGKAGEGIAAPTAAGSARGSGYRNDADTTENLIARCDTTRDGNSQDAESTTLISHSLRAQAQSAHDATLETYISHALRGEGFDASEDGTGCGTPIVPVCFDARQSDVCVYGDRAAPLDTDGFSQAIAFDARQADVHGDLMGSMRARGGSSDIPAVAFDMRGRDGGAQFEGPHNTANIRAASGGSSRSYIAAPMAVRRLTPRECERLQGFDDDWTLVPVKKVRRKSKKYDYVEIDGEVWQLAADGPRYKQLGNSMAVPVIAWIGRRILAQANQ